MSLSGLLDHLRYRRYLDANIDGELADEHLARRVAEHVAHCPMCTNTAHTTTLLKHRLSLRRFLPSHAPHRVRREEH